MITIAIACLGAAIAAWLIPASVDIVSWTRSGPTRVAVFAPQYVLWWAVAAAIVAAIGIAFVRRPDAGARAERAWVVAPIAALWLWTLPYLPWLADRVPLLLVLAGPLRWAIAIPAIAACAFRVIDGARSARLKPRPPVPAPRPPAPEREPLGERPEAAGERLAWDRRIVFVVSLVAYLLLGHQSLATVGLGGDEPHYLVITHSLLVDHDLKIGNNHARGDYRAFFGGDLRPDYMQRGKDGEIYSIHAPGLSALLLPGYAAAGASGAVVIICLFAALAAVAVFELAARAGGRLAAWATSASICFTVPFIPHAWSIYPEIAGAAIVAWGAVWLDSADDVTGLSWFGRGLVVAGLPWLHTKFVVILAVLTLFLLWRCRARLIRAAAFAAPIAVSLALWFGFFHWIYGTFDPQAPYGDYAAQFVHLENIPRSVLGTLFDQKFGLLVYAPIYAMALVGLVLILREPRWRFFVLAAAATAAPFVLSSARLYMWWGGSSAPARFVVPVLPLAAPMLAAAFRSTRVIAANAWMLCVVSLVIAIAGVAGFRGLLLFSDPHGVARIVQHLEGSSPLAAALPTFTDENWRTPLLHLLPWFAAVAAAAAVAWFGFRRWSIAGLLSAEAGAVMLVAFVFAAPFPAAMKARSVANGRLSLMRAFDPQRRRAFDLARFAKMNASEWIDATKLTFDLDPSQPADELGRLTGPLSLPPGDYLATVWSDGSAPRAGDFQIALGRGQTLARVAGPLPNPVTLPFAMPIEIPLFWMQMTDRASAQAATRLVVAPASIVPASRRFAVEPRAVESAPPRPGAYFVYTDDWAFPEGGVFWTRGTGRAEVIVVPAGAPHLLLTLHIGPSPGNVRLDVDGRTTDLAMTANETRTVPIDLPAGKPYVSVAVQSSTAFRPSEVDRSSTDVRLLGCQVRVESR